MSSAPFGPAPCRAVVVAAAAECPPAAQCAAARARHRLAIGAAAAAIAHRGVRAPRAGACRTCSA